MGLLRDHKNLGKRKFSKEGRIRRLEKFKEKAKAAWNGEAL